MSLKLRVCRTQQAAGSRARCPLRPQRRRSPATGGDAVNPNALRLLPPSPVRQSGSARRRRLASLSGAPGSDRRERVPLPVSLFGVA